MDELATDELPADVLEELFASMPVPTGKSRIERVQVAYPWACDAEATVVDMPQVRCARVRAVRGVICAWTTRGGRIRMPPFGHVEGARGPEAGPTFKSFEVTDPVELPRFGGKGMLPLTAWRSADHGKTSVCAGARVHLWIHVEDE
jgi:hypothetical protein